MRPYPPGAQRRHICCRAGPMSARCDRKRPRVRAARAVVIGISLASSFNFVPVNTPLCLAFQQDRQSLRLQVQSRRSRHSNLRVSPCSTAEHNTTIVNEPEREKKRRREATIRSVDWCGCNGMLPIQHYKGVMDNFDGWFRRHMHDSDFVGGDGLMTEDTPIEIDNAKHQQSHTGTIPPLHNLTPEEEKERKRQRKADAERRAARPLNARKHFQPIYIDDHIVAVYKASGALSVPGPRCNPSVANICHIYLGNESDDVDKMAVHRLDLDTSGIVVYARSDLALAKLNYIFRNREVKKKYQALLCGHMNVLEGEINMPLKRDKRNPPFICVDVGEEDSDSKEELPPDVVAHAGYKRMVGKAPKDSLTLLRVLAFEYMDGLPVTRVELTPVTGRTHQLRVHCASIGHPIIGDDIYGIGGEGSPNGGISDEIMKCTFPDRATYELQQDIDRIVQKRRSIALESNGEESSEDFVVGGPGNLCLHARFLSLLHPLTKAPMAFEVDAPF